MIKIIIQYRQKNSERVVPIASIQPSRVSRVIFFPDLQTNPVKITGDYSDIPL